MHKVLKYFFNISSISALLFFSSMIIGTAQVHADLIQITNNTNFDTNPQLDDGKVVWYGSDGNDSEIFLYDIATETTTQLTNNTYEDADPDLDISYGKIIWQGNSGGSDFEIFLYDIATGTTTQITNDNFNELAARIDNGKIVWVAPSPGPDYDIFLYDIVTGVTTQITNNSVDDFAPQISDGKVVWYGSDGNDSEIFLYDIATGTTTQLTNNGFADSEPQIDAGKIVWREDGIGESHIYLYDNATGITNQITDSSDNTPISPDISGDEIVWAASAGGDHQLFLYNIATSIKTQITNLNENANVPDIDNGIIVWFGSDGNDSEIFLWDGFTSPVISPLNDAMINEGNTYTENGSFTDPDSTSWMGSVDYGDGSGVQPLTLNGNNFSLSHQYTNVGTYIVTVSITDNQGGNDTVTATVTVIENNTQLTALNPAQVWISKGLLNIGVKFDLLAEAFVDDTLVSSGQLNSVTVGSGGFNNATLRTIPFDSFSPIEFPEGSSLKVKVSVRNACSGSLLNFGTARLWYNDAAANSSFGATIGETTNDYFLLDNFLLGTSVGSGPRQNIAVQAGARCSAFKQFGTWTITP